MAKNPRFSFVEEEILDGNKENSAIGVIAIVLFALAFLVLALRPGEETLPTSSESMPIIPLSPPSLTAQSSLAPSKIGTDILAQYSSPDYGSGDRTHNMELACAAIDGKEILPGGIFSFNKTVGERTTAKGYKPAPIYAADETKDEIGGGICQIASTLYLAAMQADMRIIERSCHTYTVSYMPLGMDATIYWDSNVDFRFQNPLNNPIRIFANVKDGFVNIRIEGTKQDDGYVLVDYEVLDVTEAGQTIEIAWSENSDYYKEKAAPHDGYKVQTYRCYYDSNGNEIKRVEEALSDYAKRDQQIIKGPPAGD